MVLRAVIDSNITYKPRAERLTQASTVECWGCAGTIIELGANIVDAATLAMTQVRLVRFLGLVDNRILPDPDTLLVCYLGAGLRGDVVSYWADLARRVATAPTYADAQPIGEMLRTARAAQQTAFEEVHVA